ncbi:MAG: hypothetical protein NXH73_03970 [Flavobacteriaceae bacterium]|nr:hypothetical protein [Flavobacteriaceae bacterium]
MKTIFVTSTLLLMFAFSLKAENNQPLVNGKEISQSKVDKKQTRIYIWEITTQNGKAKGVSTSEAHAKKMIEAFSKGDILDLKIITSFQLDK